MSAAASAVAAQAAGVAAEPSAALPGRGREPNPASEWREGAEPGQEQRAVFRHSRHRRNRTATRRTTPLQCRASAIGFENACEVSSGKGTTHRAGGRGLSRSPSSSWSKRLQVRTYRRQPSLRRQTIPLALRVVAEKTARGTPERRNAGTPERRNAGTPERRNAGTPERRNAGTPERRNAGTPERRNAGTPERRNAGTPERSAGCSMSSAVIIPVSIATAGYGDPTVQASPGRSSSCGRRVRRIRSIRSRRRAARRIGAASRRRLAPRFCRCADFRRSGHPRFSR